MHWGGLQPSVTQLPWVSVSQFEFMVLCLKIVGFSLLVGSESLCHDSAPNFLISFSWLCIILLLSIPVSPFMIILDLGPGAEIEPWGGFWLQFWREACFCSQLFGMTLVLVTEVDFVDNLLAWDFTVLIYLGLYFTCWSLPSSVLTCWSPLSPCPIITLLNKSLKHTCFVKR